jgi:two-component system, OmpR family, phosphate regulon response regulator OmpR
MPHVLLFEAYTPLRRVLVVTLQRAGYCVTPARSAAEAQQLMAHQAFDVLVCDLDSPGDQRGRFVTALRTVPTAIPIVALLSPEHRQQYNREPLDTRLVLSKPVSRKALIAGVKIALHPRPGPCT